MVLPGKRVLLRVAVALCLSSSHLLAQQPAPSLVERYSEEGARALAEQRYPDAEKAYEKLRQLEPQIAEVHANLGLIYFQEKKFEQAVPALRQALKLKPTLSKADTLLGMSLSELGRYSEALPALEKGFRRSTDPDVKRMCGLQLERAYTGLRRDREAAGMALELTRLYPDDPEVLYQTGRLCGNFAYLAMQKLLQVAPNSVWRYQASGELFESQGHYDLAIAQYRRVLVLSPNRPGIHYRLGRALLARRGTREVPSAPARALEALKEFQQELEIDPTNANAAYEAGEICRKLAQLDKAREYFEMALKPYPDFEEAQIGLGRVLIALRKPDLALPHLQKAISLDPENEVAYYQLALVYRASGNTAEQQKAMAEFQRVRAQRARLEESLAADVSSPREVTKQELDSEDAPQAKQ
jgi:tetratricopeptide (TPR) repeat protein